MKVREKIKKLWRILFSAELVPLLISIGLMIYYNDLPGYDFSFRIQKRCTTGSKSGVPTKVINPSLLIYKDLTNSFIFKPTSLSECNFKSFFFLCHVYFSFFQALTSDLSTTPLILHLAYLHIYLSDFLFRQLQRGNMIDLYPFQKREHY